MCLRGKAGESFVGRVVLAAFMIRDEINFHFLSVVGSSCVSERCFCKRQVYAVHWSFDAFFVVGILVLLFFIAFVCVLARVLSVISGKNNFRSRQQWSEKVYC